MSEKQRKAKSMVLRDEEAAPAARTAWQATIVQRILYSFLSIYLDRAEREVDASAVMELEYRNNIT
jgi:hypothetical protein